MSIPESDWKKFKPLKEQALDRFCDEVLREANSITSDETLTKHQRYLHLFELMQTRDKEIVELFDGHSRNRATMQLCLMAARELVTDEELRQFSDETREAVERFVSFRNE